MKLRSASLFLSLSLIAALAAGCASKSSSGKPATGTAGNGMTTGAAGTTGTAGNGMTAGTTGTAGNGTTTGTAGATGTAGNGTTSGSAGGTGTAGSGTTTGAAGDPADAGAIVDAAPDLTGWTLSWSDEFNGPAGTKPDPTYWGYDTGGGGWGVAQLQTYTNTAANASMDGNGNLAITAIKDAQGNFTSARIKTQGKFEQAYGRFEMRAKITTGNGMWPAFWMLGNDFERPVNPVPWPNCGEIDIMEVRGTQPYTNLGSLHGPGYSGMNPLTARDTLPDGGPSLSDDFHIYAIEWETNVVRFYVDTTLYETRTPADIPADAGASAHWVYDHPFFILLNVAVGGRFPGPPDGTVFPQSMLVDYVRAYKRP